MESVHELRLAITVDDYDDAVAFYRDVLGLTQAAAYDSPNGGRAVVLEAGRATIEIFDAAQADYVDEVEVGRRVAGKYRIAFHVSDTASVATRLAGAGATVVAPPTRTPWGAVNARLEGPGGLQLTLFDHPD